MSFLNNVRVVIMPGLHDSGPLHWQTRWQVLNPSFERVYQEDWENPDLDRWAASLSAELRSSQKPAIVAAHSFGCLATVQCAGVGTANLVGALLVAPADPAKFDMEERLASARLTIPSILVGSENDSWMAADQAEYWAKRWNSEFLNAGALGHINADSNLGYWLFGLSQLQRLAIQFRKPSVQKFHFANSLG